MVLEMRPQRKWFIELLQQAIISGIHIVNVTMFWWKCLVIWKYENEFRAEKIGVIWENCRQRQPLLSHLLGQNIPRNLILKNTFENAIRGRNGIIITFSLSNSFFFYVICNPQFEGVRVVEGLAGKLVYWVTVSRVLNPLPLCKKQLVIIVFVFYTSITP